MQNPNHTLKFILLHIFTSLCKLISRLGAYAVVRLVEEMRYELKESQVRFQMGSLDFSLT